MEAMRSAGSNSAFAKLPAEILVMISDENEGVMIRAEAEKFREETMFERNVSVQETDRAFFGSVRHREWYLYGD